MGVQNFNFTPEFSQSGDFQPQILYFLEHRFRRKGTISYWLKVAMKPLVLNLRLKNWKVKLF